MAKRTRQAQRSGVHTLYELWFIRRIKGQETATVATYDELNRHEAETDFQGLCRQAGEEIGREQTLSTSPLRAELSGVIDRAVVELRSRKVGDFTSMSQAVMTEVFLDDSTLSAKARSVRDGLLAAPAEDRAKVFGDALAQVGGVGSVGGRSEYGRVCRAHNRWVGRWQTDDRCWHHAWGDADAEAVAK